MSRRAWLQALPALAATALGLAWQLLTVHYNYGGNLTALYCTGSARPLPPELAWEHIYIFRGSSGYDGEEYHYIAHDPLDENGIGRYVDTGARYRRILLPAMAYLAALGQQEWIDRAYFACNLVFLFLGSWFLARLLERRGRNTWWAILYLVVPATLISLDRLTVDLALGSLALGFTLYVESMDEGWRQRGKLFAILALVALCRDSGVLLTLAVMIPLAVRRRFRESLLWAMALMPALAWNVFVSWHVPEPMVVPKGRLFVPFSGWVEPFLHPPIYHLAAGWTLAVRAFDWLQLFGLLLAFVLGLRQWRKAKSDAVAAACFLWAAIGIFWPALWQLDPYATRLVSPLLLWQFLGGDRAPMAMVAPRGIIQLTPQVLGVARGLLAG